MKILLASLFLICTMSDTIFLPFGGNAWATTNGQIKDSGYNFKNINSVVTAYIYIGSSKPNAWVAISLSNTVSIMLDVTIGSKTVKRNVKASSRIRSVNIGLFNFTQNSYNKIIVTVVKTSISTSISGIIEGASITSTFTDLWYTQNNNN